MALLLPDFVPILSVSGLELALDQPFFPGKIILWLLFMLSLMSWAVMISKLVSFRKYREGDGVFTKQLRKSKSPLEIHEKSWEAPMSLRQEIYNCGAKEAAFQVLGTIRRKRLGGEMEENAALTDSQMVSLREALGQGEKAAAARLDIGMPVLQASAAGAPFLGLLGLVWLMMGSFTTPEANQIAPGISAGLAVMAIGLIAATPAIFGQIILRSMIRSRMRELGGFRMELFRLFERALSRAWQIDDEGVRTAPVTAPVFKESEAGGEPAVEEGEVPPPKKKERVIFDVEKPRRVKKKVFKPIRQDEPMINPIAMQTKGAEG